MPKLKKPPPAGVMKHLVDRFRDGRISVADFEALQDWLNADPEVPSGKWYKRFPKFILAGEGEQPKTFLTPDIILLFAQSSALPPRRGVSAVIYGSPDYRTACLR